MSGGFGAYLVEQGLVLRQQLERALKRQLENLVPLGRLAVEEGTLSPEQVAELRRIQMDDDRRLGEIALDLRWLTREDLRRLLDLQRARQPRLGEILVTMGALSREAMEGALTRYAEVAARRRQELEGLLDEIPRGELLAGLIDLTVRYLHRATGEVFTVAALYLEGGPGPMGWPDEAVLVAQRVTGDAGLLYGLLLDESWIRFIAGAMLEFQAAPTPELARDAVGELVNVIVGNTLSRMGSLAKGLQSLPPVVVRPGSIGAELARCARVEFVSPRGPIEAVAVL